METSDFYAVLGHSIQSRRKELGIVTVKLAQKLNISQQQISRYERGLSVLSPDVMLRYCAALGMTEREISELFSIISTHYQSVISGPEDTDDTDNP
ncbi:helix-turn-helix transcriptional regulator [Morganella morganii]